MDIAKALSMYKSESPERQMQRVVVISDFPNTVTIAVGQYGEAEEFELCIDFAAQHNCKHNCSNILNASLADEGFISAFLGNLSLMQTSDRFKKKVIYTESDIERAAVHGNFMANYLMNLQD